MSEKIKVGITHGDINGVGYEVIVKSLAPEGITDLFTPVVFGYPELVEKAAEISDIPNFPFVVIPDLSEVYEDRVNILPPSVPMPSLTPGLTSKEAGMAAVDALETGVKALKNGDIDILVTAPISKEGVQSENFNYPGHTEFLEDRAGEGNKSLMVLCNDKLRVALLSIHIPLAKVAEQVTQENLIKSIGAFNETLKRDFGAERPSIAVLSLNPHGGDGGLLGTEEKEIIEPALALLRANGILAFGPFPADGFFGHGSFSHFDGILAMYHDQGLAPFKTIATSGGVNFTAGLPFVRTSPDHGTAFDIAWKGEADPSSMRDAIYMGIDIFRRRQRFEEAASNPLKKYIHDKPEKGERGEKYQTIQ